MRASTAVVLCLVVAVVGAAGASAAQVGPQQAGSVDCDGRTSVPSELDLGSVAVGESTTESWTVENPLNYSVTIDRVSIGGEDADAFTLLGSGGPITVGAGQCHTVRVRFSPDEPGDYDATVTVATGSDARSTSLDGEGVEPPEPDPSLGSDGHDFGNVSVGTSTERTFVLSNDGDAPTAIESVAVTGADDFSLVGRAPETVPAGGTVELTVRFAPSATGRETGTLRVATNASDPATLTASLAGGGTDTELSASPTSVAFGNVSAGERVRRTVTVENTGTEPVDLAGLAVEGDGADGFTVVEGATGRIEAGATREVTVAFEPAAAGRYGAVLKLRTGDPDVGTLGVTLSGTGTAPDIQITPKSVNFGETVTDEAVTRVLRVSNRGGEPLSVTDLSVVGRNPDAFTVLDGSGEFTVQPGESRRVSVRFTPPEAGAFSATLVVSSDDPDEGTATVYLSNTQTTVTRETEPTGNRTRRADVEVEDASDNATLTFVFSGAGEGSAAGAGGVAGSSADASQNARPEVMRLNVGEGGDFRLGMSWGPNKLRAFSNFTRRYENGTAPVEYYDISHTIPDEDIDSVEFQFRVGKDRLDRLNASVEDFSMYRNVDGEWVELNGTVVEETPSSYVVAFDSPGLSEFVTGVEQPKFELVEAAIQVQEIEVDDETAIEVTIDNVGGADGVYEAQLLLDGEVVDRKAATVAPGGRRVMLFEREVTSAGTYTVQVNDVTVGQLEVNRAATDDGGAADTAEGSGDGAGGGDADDDAGSDAVPIHGFGPVVALLAGLVAAARLARRDR